MAIQGDHFAGLDVNSPHFLGRNPLRRLPASQEASALESECNGPYNRYDDQCADDRFLCVLHVADTPDSISFLLLCDAQQDNPCRAGVLSVLGLPGDRSRQSQRVPYQGETSEAAGTRRLWQCVNINVVEDIKGMPDIVELYDGLCVLDGKIMVCELCLTAKDLKAEDMREEVEIVGATTFLSSLPDNTITFCF